ncbi:AraC-like DNA-binding protein [Chryseobacterium sp. SLBN-27]|uniref:helix-turn-helix domain-containing protein n=1 Tax=Chryseobacterium sp. SLBN-27 TaxID=3042287 RepID=UPI0028541E3F|nr:helix-turn-helix domain-containing protein [Chryseobacterium sp. SLBN-27]MDR6159355.1 AraC-like DNA-binding protein [Chryseobacterium sp. SLBN-27]
MKIVSYILIMLWYCSCSTLCAQKSKKPNDSLLTFSYSELENKFYSLKDNNKIEEAKLIAQFYLKKAKIEKDKDHIAEGYVLMHYNRSFANSLKYIDSLEAIKKNLQDDIYPTRIYLLKGRLYYDFDDVKLALNNFINALKYAKEKKNKRHIAIAEVYIAYLNNYIGKHTEAAKVLQYYYDNGDFLDENAHEHVRLNLASTLLDVNKLKSAEKLINEGLKSTSGKNEIDRYNQYLSLFGLYSLKSKEYKTAIDSLKKSKAYFSNQSNDLSLNYTLLYLGQSYAGLQEKEKTVQYFAQIDSIIQKTNNTFPELKEVYPYLIDYYKEKNDKQKQLYYIERFLEVYKTLDSKFRYVSRELPRRYDAPKLLQEKESIISEMESKKTAFQILISFLLLGVFILVYLYIRSKKAEKKHRKIAQNLIQSVYENTFQKQTEAETEEEIFLNNKTPQDDIEKSIEDKTVRTISDDVVKIILRELDMFETKGGFLKKGITLGSLAKKAKTNSKYLSEIINTHKGKNFASYLNDLRIDYAINKLAKDKKFRSYKLPFIAEELGYNNEQAFTLAFKKRTGTPLTIYLKEIAQSEKQSI